MKQFLTAKDIAGIMGVSLSKAYEWIRDMNMELKDAGYLTVSGKVPEAYFATKFYGYVRSERQVSNG